MTQDKSASERMEKIVSLCKRRGFIMQSSEIYGGLNGCWDYGPLGTELKRNLKDFWWRRMVRERDDIVGMDGSILMNRQVWVASGHEATFSDPMVDCGSCKSRLRVDQLSEKDGKLHCPVCGSFDLTEARAFNLMFKTYVGATEDESAITYLRPETAQAIFVQFKNVLEVSRKKVPFGIAQIGKAFRNEINPRNFTFRSREFEQIKKVVHLPAALAAEILISRAVATSAVGAVVELDVFANPKLHAGQLSSWASGSSWVASFSPGDGLGSSGRTSRP